MTYVRKVIVPIVGVAVAAAVIPTIVYNEMPISVLSFFVVCALCVICTIAAAYYIGTSKDEKSLIQERIVAIYNKFHK